MQIGCDGPVHDVGHQPHTMFLPTHAGRGNWKYFYHDLPLRTMGRDQVLFPRKKTISGKENAPQITAGHFVF
jgi:hypothetical protein